MKPALKILVLNFSGNVGKSTVSQHLLFPRLDDPTLIPVESLNSNEGIDAETVRGKQFGEVINSLSNHSSAVVDVGASNVEEWMMRMSQYKDSHQDFDLVVVPVVSARKQQVDTMATLDALNTLGVPAEKIRVVFNKIEPTSLLKKEFEIIFSYHETTGNFRLEPHVAIQENEMYGLLQGKSIREVLEDSTDFAQKIKESTTKEERLEWSKRRGLKRLATGVAEELDRAFALLVEGV